MAEFFSQLISNVKTYLLDNPVVIIRAVVLIVVLIIILIIVIKLNPARLVKKFRKNHEKKRKARNKAKVKNKSKKSMDTPERIKLELESGLEAVRQKIHGRDA